MSGSFFFLPQSLLQQPCSDLWRMPITLTPPLNHRPCIEWKVGLHFNIAQFWSQMNPVTGAAKVKLRSRDHKESEWSQVTKGSKKVFFFSFSFRSLISFHARMELHRQKPKAMKHLPKGLHTKILWEWDRCYPTHNSFIIQKNNFPFGSSGL